MSALLVRFCCMAQPQWNIGTRRMEGCALVPPCMEHVVMYIFVFTSCVGDGSRKIKKIQHGLAEWWNLSS